MGSAGSYIEAISGPLGTAHGPHMARKVIGHGYCKDLMMWWPTQLLLMAESEPVESRRRIWTPAAEQVEVGGVILFSHPGILAF